MLKNLKIGNITFKNNLFMAPMAGITLKPFRTIIKKMGAGSVCTELISSYGLVYQNEKTKDMVDISDCNVETGQKPVLYDSRSLEYPISVQLFGDGPQVMADAAKIVEEMGADIIDINMGCPVPKVVKTYAGSGLLRNEDLIKKILDKVVSVVKIPVTIKIRAGWDEKSLNYLNVGQIAEDCGVKAISFHARTRSQGFGPGCNWDYIKELKQSVNIPVIGNGDILTVEDAVKMFKQTNCDGVMIGRGALSNPWIFKQINDYYTKGTYEKIADKEKIEFIIEFSKNFVNYLPKKRGIFEIRKFIGWITKGMSNAKEIRKQAYETTELDELLITLKRYI